MKKKLLEKLPMKQIQLTKKNKKWVIIAQTNAVDGDKTLVIDLYRNDSCIMEPQYPQHRLCLNDKEDFIYNFKEKAWCSKKIENLHGMPGYGTLKDYYELHDDETGKEIDSFLPINHPWDSDYLDRVRNKQEENRSKKSSRAYQLRVERIKTRMKIVNEIPIPDDFIQFIDESFIDFRHAFYTYDGGKRYLKIICSHCKSERKLDTKTECRPKHNAYGFCQHCGSRIQYHSPGWSPRLTDIKEFILMQKIEGGFVSRYYDAVRNSTEGNEYYKVVEKARVIYDGKSAKTYYNLNGENDSNKAYWWDKNAMMYSYDSRVTYGKGILYHKNIDEVIRDTTFKYCALKQLADHKHGYVINHELFLSHFEGNRYLEYFIKMGLYNLANDVAEHYWTTSINKEGKNPLEILKISKEQLNRLIKIDGNLYTLKLLQAEAKTGRKFSDEQIIFMTQNTVDVDRLEKILEHTTTTKAIRYIQEPMGYKTSNTLLIEWSDYLENCKKLEYDMNNEFVIFPRNLKEAHDRTSLLVTDIRNKELDIKLKELMSALAEKYQFETEHYTIVLPNITSDIIREGQELHHCVGTYVDRVVKGETTILFVREKEFVNQPFYTMEVKNGTIVQVRGKNNKDMTPQVKQFVKSFTEKRLKKVDDTYKQGGGNVA